MKNNKHIETFSTFTEKLKQQRLIKEEEEANSKRDTYANFFKELLKKYNVTSPADLTDDKKKDFFNDITKGWEKGEGVTPAGEKMLDEDKVNEEIYDLVSDLVRILGRNNSQSRVEGYLGRSLSSYEVRELKRARVIR